jgi:hypothetical protein
MLILAAGAFFVGILRTGVLYVGAHSVEPAPYFVGCITVMIAAAALIVIIGSRWPNRPNNGRSE